MKVRNSDSFHIVVGDDSSHRSAAREQAIGFLRPGESSWHFSESGVIDVLGDADPIESRFVHQLVHSKLLPRIYERVWRPITGRLFFGREMSMGEELRTTLQMLGISAGENVLDVGCGPGNYTRALAREAGDGVVVGMDASKSMLELAVKRGGGSNLTYVRGDACDLPFVDGKFNVVCCVGVIHMIPDAMAALDEMVRVLSPGGRLVVVASYGESDAKSTLPGGVKVFGRTELTRSFAERGMVDIDQLVSHRAQFVGGRKEGE